MMKALCNSSSSKDCEYNPETDRNSIEMKYLNLKSSVNSSYESTSEVENSMVDMRLNTEQADSLLNSHESESSSFPNVCASEAGCISEDDGIGGTVSDDLQMMLKRQGLTVEELLQSAPPFAVEWKSVRDVFQCLTCAAPIDFLSRKVS